MLERNGDMLEHKPIMLDRNPNMLDHQWQHAGPRRGRMPPAVNRRLVTFAAARTKRTLAIGLGLVLVSLAAVRVYFGFVPLGAAYHPWTQARVDGPELRSPDGRRVVRVYFNDAGAMHSGNHWTWVVEDSWLWGRRVVGEGYLGSHVAVGGEPVPLEWGPDNQIRVMFLSRRYGSDVAPTSAGPAAR